MTTTLTRPPASGRTHQELPTSRAYTALIASSGVAILLQGLWAGIFLGRTARGQGEGGWLEIHAHGGEVALVLAALATIVGFVSVRGRRDLWLGGTALTLLLVLEAWIGGRIHDSGQAALTAVHVPLALGITGLAVWLLVRSRRTARG